MALSKTFQPGFEKKRFTVAVQDIFECAICKLVAREPRQCSNEHVFCLNCVTEALSVYDGCPACRTQLTIETLMPVSRLVRTLYDKLTLKCIGHEDAGCRFHGTIVNVMKHEEKFTVKHLEMKIAKLEEENQELRATVARQEKNKCFNCVYERSARALI